MNEHMAHRAGLEFLALVMHRTCWCPRRVDIVRASVGRNARGMALETQDVDLVYLQQAWIHRPMRLMTRGAPFRLDRNMFEDKWALKVAVALEADLFLIGSSMQ